MRNLTVIKVLASVLAIALFVTGNATVRSLPQISSQQEPAPVKAVAPIYPLIAAATGISGSVTVEVEIDQQGVVQAAHSIDGPKPLQPAAEYSASRWLFNPADQTARIRVARLTFVFDLVSGDPPSVELVPLFFPPYRIEIKTTKPRFIHRVDSDPPKLRKPRPKRRHRVRATWSSPPRNELAIS